jgi:hypothetical protein
MRNQRTSTVSGAGRPEEGRLTDVPQEQRGEEGEEAVEAVAERVLDLAELLRVAQAAAGAQARDGQVDARRGAEHERREPVLRARRGEGRDVGRKHCGGVWGTRLVPPGYVLAIAGACPAPGSSAPAPRGLLGGPTPRLVDTGRERRSASAADVADNGSAREFEAPRYGVVHACPHMCKHMSCLPHLQRWLARRCFPRNDKSALWVKVAIARRIGPPRVATTIAVTKMTSGDLVRLVLPRQSAHQPSSPSQIRGSAREGSPKRLVPDKGRGRRAKQASASASAADIPNSARQR